VVLRVAAVRRAIRVAKVFAYHFHDTKLTSPRQTRHAIAYVLDNWRRHDEDRGSWAEADPYYSGPTFDGWAQLFEMPAGYEPVPSRGPSRGSCPSAGARSRRPRHGHRRRRRRDGPDLGALISSRS
jgi:hypothetical protein